MKKYTEDKILDLSETNIHAEKDLMANLFTDTGIFPASLLAYNAVSDKVDKSSLIALGNSILSMLKKSNLLLIQLRIPSDKIINIDHAVALAIDKKNARIIYHNSYGMDLRKDVKEFLMGILSGYSWDFKTSVQQLAQEDDYSCAYLSLYNLHDIMNEINGIGGIKNFNSRQARRDLWNRIKDLEIEPNLPKLAPSFTFGKEITIIKKGVAEFIKKEDTRNQRIEDKQQIQDAIAQCSANYNER